ncbi:MAG: hypothetical protein PHP54_00960 [Clostridia bacterium]|nr:hypothetical protein [Clostridia bacterium]
MKCNFEAEHINLDKLSFDEMKQVICRKIAKIIIYNEEKIDIVENEHKLKI